MTKLPLTGDELVEEVVEDFPTTSPFLREWGIVCIKCGEPVWGTLREIIAAKGKNVDDVLAALNHHLAR